jgi:ABC-type transport system substrate-binding protein
MSEPSSIDPGFVQGEAGQMVVDALFDSLVALDEDLQPVPAAAASWEMNEDATSFTFTLAEGTFHNGDPVRARDFVRAFNRIARGAAENGAVAAFLLESIVGYEEAVTDGTDLEGVVAIDQRRLRIDLRYRFPDFITVVADPALAPVPQGANAEGWGENPVGNGPFKMGEPWQHGQFVRVLRFDEHRAPALLDEVVFTIYDDDPTLERQWEDLSDGQLDVGNVPAERIDDAIDEFGRSSDGFSGPGYLGGLTGTIYYFGFNTQVRPFNNPAVRRAFSLVMDRESIAADIMQESRASADAIVPPSIIGALDSPCDHCEFNPQLARQLLEEAGGAGLFDGPIRIYHNQGTTHEAIADAVADSITDELGLETTVTSLDLDDYVTELRTSDIPIFRFGWTATYAGAGSYLYPLFHASRTGSDNLSRFENGTISDALNAARRELDQEARITAYQRVEEDILERVPIAPLLFYRQTMVVAERVHDFHRGPLGNVDLSVVWLDQS